MDQCETALLPDARELQQRLSNLRSLVCELLHINQQLRETLRKTSAGANVQTPAAAQKTVPVA
jgi:hypothetical protein